jgi:SAM-dependent methyltransferase
MAACNQEGGPRRPRGRSPHGLHAASPSRRLGTELQHPDSRGFELVADAYERARPNYPPDVIAWFTERLDLRPGRTVLDLGAGTGKLTRSLVEAGARVLALEPGDEMRARLAAVVPEAEPIAAGAEAIPVAAGSVDAATAGQSFHWFRWDEAVPEVHRILRPGGGLGLVWNERNPDDPLQQTLADLLRPFRPAWQEGRARHAGWREVIARSGLFSAFEEYVSGFVNELDADGLVERLATTSFVAAASPARQAELERSLRELAAAHGGTVRFVYRTEAFVTFSVG